MEIIAIVILVALVIVVAALIKRTEKPAIMKVVYPDKSWFIGQRGNKEIGLIPHETRGTHHFTVLGGSPEFKELVGQEVAVPIDKVKYFVINPKNERKEVK